MNTIKHLLIISICLFNIYNNGLVMTNNLTGLCGSGQGVMTTGHLAEEVFDFVGAVVR